MTDTRRRWRWCIYSPLSPPLIDVHWSVESSSCAPPGYLTISQPKWCGFWEGTQEGNCLLYSFITTNITVTTTQLNPSGQLTLLGFHSSGISCICALNTPKFNACNNWHPWYYSDEWWPCRRRLMSSTKGFLFLPANINGQRQTDGRTFILWPEFQQKPATDQRRPRNQAKGNGSNTCDHIITISLVWHVLHFCTYGQDGWELLWISSSQSRNWEQKSWPTRGSW